MIQMEDPATSQGLIYGAIMAAFGTLSSVIALLWKLNESKNKEAITELQTRSREAICDLQGRCDILQKRSDACEEHRDVLSQQLAEVKTQQQLLAQRLEFVNQKGTAYTAYTHRKEQEPQ